MAQRRNKNTAPQSTQIATDTDGEYTVLICQARCFWGQKKQVSFVMIVYVIIYGRSTGAGALCYNSL